MGCCQSKQDTDDDDSRAPLLPEAPVDSVPNYHSNDIIDAKQEERFWNDVIHRTTHNLIDIAMTQPDPLQVQDIQDRTEKYQAWLEHYQAIQPPKTGINGVNGTAIALDAGAIVAHARVSPLTKEQREKIDQAASSIQQAIEKIHVQFVGDIVVRLTMPDASPTIASY